MPDLKISQFTADATPSLLDYTTTIKDPFGAGSNRKVLLSDLTNLILANLKDGDPASLSLSFTSDSTTGIFYNGSGSIGLVSSGTQIGNIGGTNTFFLNQPSFTTGVPTLFSVAASDITGVTASNTITDFSISLNRTVTWQTGNLAIQRFFNANLATTLAFAGASTVTAAVGASFTGMPTGGTNATLSLSIGAFFEGGSSNATDIYGVLMSTPNIANGKGNVGSLYTLQIAGGLSSSSLGNQTANLTNLAPLRVDAITYTSTTNTRTVTGDIAGAILNAPVAGTNVSFSTTSLGLLVKTGESRFAGALSPITNAGAALGTNSLMWSALRLSSGGIINFNNGDLLVTHSANNLAFTGSSGATLGYSFDNNVMIGVATAGASAVSTLCLSNSATEPTTTVDRTHLYSKDISAGNATLGIYTERAVAVDVIGASTHTLTVFINGTQYKILLST